ncbi:MAG: DnaD domain-containing protein [Desulfurispora sp.]|uniref:DnaD domain-containing protein n=1 Tax=Desulfurispora sp. TaxID=3014275 RepID=UPI0040493326
MPPSQPEAAAAARVQEALQQAGILAPSPVQVQKLTAWLTAGLELEVVLWAIEKAALANVRRVDYIDAICRNLYNAGVRTLDQARDESSRHAAARQRPGSRWQSRAAPPPGDAPAEDPEQAAAREKKRRLIESLYCN